MITGVVSRPATDSSIEVLRVALAETMAELERQRGQVSPTPGQRSLEDRFGYLAHELRNFLENTILALAAIRSGSVPIEGCTATALHEDLSGLRDMIDRILVVRRLSMAAPANLSLIAVDQLVAEVALAATASAHARGCDFQVSHVKPGLAVVADRHRLGTAASTLVDNALRRTGPRSTVELRAFAAGDRIRIEVVGTGSGSAGSHLPEGEDDLAIVRQAMGASGGELLIRELGEGGSIFTLDLPRR